MTMTRSENTGKTTQRLWTAALIAILVLAVISRFAGLGIRATSHDETTHAKYSWNLYSGRGFSHDPLMHGPLLFEMSALFYFLFGVSNFSTRIYTALSGVALVMVPWLFRKYLGKKGALITSVMLLISPAISYYSRYTRHDVPIILFTMLLLWCVLKYLDDGKVHWLYGMGAAYALMYASKENAYIYTAIILPLLALPFVWRVLTTRWAKPQMRTYAILLLVIAMIAGATFVMAMRSSSEIPEAEGVNAIGDVAMPAWGRLAMSMAFLAVLGLVLVVIVGVGEEVMRSMRLFDVLMVLGTLTVPLGSGLLMNYVAGLDMSVLYPALMGGTRTMSTLPPGYTFQFFAILILMLGISTALGLWWQPRKWLGVAASYYSLFLLSYTTFLTYGWGAITGLVGGLTYWMSQQSVQRGSQPWYYYPMVGWLYEYLPLAVSAIAGIFGISHAVRKSQPASEEEADADPITFDDSALVRRWFPVFLLLWAVMSWGAYIVAGEKMPWLFVHIGLPHILLAAWGLDKLLSSLSWKDIIHDYGWLLGAALFFFWRAWVALQQSSGSLAAIMEASGASEGLGTTLEKLAPIGRIAGGLGGLLLMTWFIVQAVERLGLKRAFRLTVAFAVLLLSVFTVRTMVMLNFHNAELGKEYMVFAHSTPDVRMTLDRVEELSWRITGTPDQIKVAYDKEVAWPFYWYMDAHYPNNYYFAESPDEVRLLECPVIIAERSQWDTVEGILGSEYDYTQYNHIWWPIEDYKNQTWESFLTYWNDPAWRAAVWDIITDRDYEAYAYYRNPEDPFTQQTWPHRFEYRLYVRRDLAQDIWAYQVDGDGTVQQASFEGVSASDDPFAAYEITPSFIANISLPESTPRDIVAAYDDTLYVSDTTLHRIWHLDHSGVTLNSWGSYGSGHGEFNEPWGLATDNMGQVYVADTWNHRVQVFDEDGNWLNSWGRLGESQPFDYIGQGAFFGPRDVAVTESGNVYVADTGNNRIQVFDMNGVYSMEFGGQGQEPGLFNEPVTLAFDEMESLLVGDQWNQRVQQLSEFGISQADPMDIPTWMGLKGNQRPTINTAGGLVLVTDLTMQRVLAYQNGTLLWALRDTNRLTSVGSATIARNKLFITDPEAGMVLIYAVP